MSRSELPSNQAPSSAVPRLPVEVASPRQPTPAEDSLEQALHDVRKQAEHVANQTLPKFVGPFAIRAKLGEGTYGVVYEAEQVDPIKRTVAVKVLKAGWLGGEVLARFERERHLLGAMKHPGIASIYDAGVTEDRRPWFAMELVRGQPLTEYCREKRLPLRARLVLIEQVCWAVFHAHQKLIVHRDLTPRNILVEEVDGVPTPKVIDFGVSKALAGGDLPGDGTWSTESTLVGTPYYMSPEQAQGAKGVDVRTDVYAMGAILYEIVTGRKLFGASDLEDGSVQSMMNAVCKSSPTEFRNDSLDDSIDGESKRIIKELWWIASKAIEKDVERRYGGLDRLARDLRSLLDNRPVEAGPVSATYRLRKGVQRHKVAVALLCASVVAVGAVTVMFAHSAKVAKQNLVQKEVGRLKLAHSRGDWKIAIDAFDSLEPYGYQPGLDEQLMYVEALDACDRSAEAMQRLEHVMADSAAAADPRALLWKGDLMLAQGLRSGLREEAIRSIQAALDRGTAVLPDADKEYGRGLLSQEWPDAKRHFANASQLRPSHRRASMMTIVSSTMCGDAVECRRAIDRWRLQSESDWQVLAAEVLYSALFASPKDLHRAIAELQAVNRSPSVQHVCSVAKEVHTAWNSPVNPLDLDGAMGPAVVRMMNAGFGLMRSTDSSFSSIRSSTALGKSVNSLSVPLMLQAQLNPGPAIEKLTAGVPLFEQFNWYFQSMDRFSRIKNADPKELVATAKLLDKADSAPKMPALSCAIPYCRIFVEAALRRRAPESSVLPDDKIEELFSRVLATWSIKA
ncbi:MAG: protein kinase, partial [Planctomycetes bacterium]|nr:protein kinase [Planctomycetota bacterium]